MSLTDGDGSSVKEEFAYNGSCPYCHSISIRMNLLEGSYPEKEAKEHGYWRKRYCKCNQCGKEWFGMDYYDTAQSMKKPNLINAGVASFVIGVVGAAIGGFFSMFLAVFAPASDDFPYVIASGSVSGFFICFLGSMWFLSMMWNRGDKAIRSVGALFGVGAGALSTSISVIFVDLVICPGCLSGVEDADWSYRLGSDFLLGVLSGAVIGVIAALIITYFPGMILLRWINGQPSKSPQSDSAPTEKK
jgi:hypothetical protein